MDREEKQWLRRYRRGEVDALEYLVERYRRPLFSFILRMTEGRGDPEEVFQEVWIRAIRKMDAFHEKNLIGWLFRIAHNLIIDEARKNRPMVPLGGSSNDDDAPVPEPASTRLGPDDEAAGHDLGRRINESVTKLPPEQREVFVLRMHADLPFKDIARIQQVSINTALARMQYALQKLRQDLRDEYWALGDRMT